MKAKVLRVWREEENKILFCLFVEKISSRICVVKILKSFKKVLFLHIKSHKQKYLRDVRGCQIFYFIPENYAKKPQKTRKIKGFKINQIISDINSRYHSMRDIVVSIIASIMLG